MSAPTDHLADQQPDSGDTAENRPPLADEPGAHSPVDIRIAHPGDGPLLHQLAADVGGLDVNTRYFYELMATMFTATCRVAADDEGPLGFLVGVRPPERPASVFVWQVGVLPRGRGRGVARALLDHFVDAAQPAPAALEATVTPSNQASRRLFASFAAARGSEVQWRSYLTAESLSDASSGHEREDLLHIPLPR